MLWVALSATERKDVTLLAWRALVATVSRHPRRSEISRGKEETPGDPASSLGSYSPNLVEGNFCELCNDGVLGR